IVAGDLGHMDINVRVDESDIARIRPGQHATFTVDAFAGRTFQAVVRQVRIAPQIVQNVVTYTVVLTTENRDHLLLPGMTVLARIVTDRTPPSTTVPLAALRYRPRHPASAHDDSRQTGLWVLADGSPRRIPVTIGQDDGTNVVVASDDLRSGDRVIVGDAPRGPAHTP
ncbi:MAG: efflux RND transporter periplasmic adaptor subunit, partial [Rhizobiales bacterium]|nr:efflux RND transporter periplasmic adaptor subunit [Hyphomicrobiales bacterium]